MKNSQSNSHIIVIGPGPNALGGITAVIQNYSKSKFWRDQRCIHFTSMTDYDNLLAKNIYAFWRILVFTARLTFTKRPTAASIHTSHSGSFYRKLIYLIICKAFRIPTALHVHPAAYFEYYTSSNRFRQALIRWSGRLSNRIVFLSEGILQNFSGVFDADRLRVLGNPVDIDQYVQARQAGEPERPRVLFLGAIAKEKGVYDLVECIPIVTAAIPDVIFSFAGNKEVEKLAALVSDRGLNDSAEVLGWIDGQQKLDLLQSSSVLILPSYTEGVPNVILEAMASHLPIIATPVGGIPNVLDHNKTAILVEPGNIEAIANSLIDLLSNPDKAHALADTAFAEAKSLYSIEKIGEELTSIYDEIVPSLSPPR